MATSKSKEEILQENGYRYHFVRMIYFNLEKKKVFSFEVIDDNSESWLEQKINEANKEDWEFYSNSALPEQIKNDIKKELGS
jgi:hypothetical protein